MSVVDVRLAYLPTQVVWVVDSILGLTSRAAQANNLLWSLRLLSIQRTSLEDALDRLCHV
ncbi:MAG TPA: hypothetical protein V6D19_03015 [Stenomitos sp.]